MTRHACNGRPVGHLREPIAQRAAGHGRAPRLPLNASLIFNEIYDSELGTSLPSLESRCDDSLPVSIFVLGNDYHDLSSRGVQGWGSGKRYFISANTFTDVAEPMSVSPLGAGSAVSMDASAFEQGAAAFEAYYGVDIR